MPINLDAARRSVERIMGDTCRILRDPGDLNSATLNEFTGQLVEPDDDRLIYSGPCFIQAGAGGGGGVDVGLPATTASYTIRVRHNALDIRPGDMVIVTKSADPTLKARRLSVTDVVRGSLVVWREFTAETVESARG